MKPRDRFRQRPALSRGALEHKSADGSSARLGTVSRSAYHEIERPREAQMPTLESVVHSDPQVLGGTPVFVGTRVPVKNLLDYLAAGDSLERFLDHFPSVTREQAVAALEIAKDLLISCARPAR
jgi:uncharacterized protein (DUF433 family)